MEKSRREGTTCTFTWSSSAVNEAVSDASFLGSSTFSGTASTTFSTGCSITGIISTFSGIIASTPTGTTSTFSYTARLSAITMSRDSLALLGFPDSSAAEDSPFPLALFELSTVSSDCNDSSSAARKDKSESEENEVSEFEFSAELP